MRIFVKSFPMKTLKTFRMNVIVADADVAAAAVAAALIVVVVEFDKYLC